MKIDIKQDRIKLENTYDDDFIRDSILFEVIKSHDDEILKQLLGTAKFPTKNEITNCDTLIKKFTEIVFNNIYKSSKPIEFKKTNEIRRKIKEGCPKCLFGPNYLFQTPVFTSLIYDLYIDNCITEDEMHSLLVIRHYFIALSGCQNLEPTKAHR